VISQDFKRSDLNLDRLRQLHQLKSVIKCWIVFLLEHEILVLHVPSLRFLVK
jgi:hypothetical protein